MAARTRRAARAGYIDSDWGLVHLPDLFVPDHDELRIGFLHHRFRKAEVAEPELLPRPNPAWAAPQKFERRR